MARLEDFPAPWTAIWRTTAWMEARYYAALDDWIRPGLRRSSGRCAAPWRICKGYSRKCAGGGRCRRSRATFGTRPPAGGARRPGGGVSRALGGLLLPGNVELYPPGRHQGGHDRPVRASGYPPGAGGGLRDERNDCSSWRRRGWGGHGNAAPEAMGGGAAGDMDTNQEAMAWPGRCSGRAGGGHDRGVLFRQLDKARRPTTP